jgi:hypothetical protein
LDREEAIAMSRETSCKSERRYGIRRVCQVLEFPRSTLYAQAKRQSSPVGPLQPLRRGPKPRIGDGKLLGTLRDDLASPPFQGEGHRKVWARLRWRQDIRVSRARVLRLMRDNALRSPHRRPQGRPHPHEERITTDRPNEVWGTDGIRIETIDEGWIWGFSAVDHFDACCVGIHAVKTGGNRFAALHPLSQGLQAEFGCLGADAGRGLALHMDHGTQYTSDEFLNQIKFWGVAPSFALCLPSHKPTAWLSALTERSRSRPSSDASSETSRMCGNVEDVRDAANEFRERYNRHWRLEKLGFMPSLEARQAYAMKMAA